MHSYQAILNPVLVVFITVGTGIALRKSGYISAELDRALTRLIISLFFPCLIFSKILGNPALALTSNLVWAPAIGFVCVAGGYLVCYFVAPLFGIRSPASRGAFSLTTGNFNYGFIPIPLAIALFDDQTVGTLFIHNVGVEVALWSVGIALLTGNFTLSALRHAVNPPLVTIVVSVTLTLTHLDRFVPPVLSNTADSIGQCAIPCVLLMIGLTIGNHLNSRPSWSALRVAIPGCVLRLAILPAIMLCMAIYLPITTELKRVIVLQVSMPSAVFPILLASHYHSDSQTALRIVLSTSALSIITTPLWLTFGLRLIAG